MNCKNYNSNNYRCTWCDGEGTYHSITGWCSCNEYIKEEKVNMNKINIKFAKVNPNAKIPSKRVEDAGYDIYACVPEGNSIIIMPHETKLIPTGIASSCSSDYCFILKERGSTGTKGMAQRCGVIDSGYRNEWFVPITNTTDKAIGIANTDDGMIPDEPNVTWYPYNKAICQALVIPVPETEVEEISYEELKAIPSERGMGSRGSSGK